MEFSSVRRINGLHPRTSASEETLSSGPDGGRGLQFQPCDRLPLLAATLPRKKGQKPSAGQKRVSEMLKNTPEESWGFKLFQWRREYTEVQRVSLKRNVEGVSEEFNSGRGWWWLRTGRSPP